MAKPDTARVDRVFDALLTCHRINPTLATLIRANLNVTGLSKVEQAILAEQWHAEVSARRLRKS